MEQQVAIFHPIRIIRRVQQAYTWKLFFINFQYTSLMIKLGGDGALMNAADTSLQEAATNHTTDLFIY